AAGHAAVIDEVGLAEPGDGSGLQSAEDSPGALGSGGGGIVVVGGRAEPPAGIDPPQPRARRLAVAGAGAAGGAVALGELRIPVTLEPAELQALIGRGHVDAGDLPDQRSLILQAQAEGQVQLPALEIP